MDPFAIAPVRKKPFRDCDEADLLAMWESGGDLSDIAIKSGIRYAVLYPILRMQPGFRASTLKRNAVFRKRNRDADLRRAIAFFREVWNEGGMHKYCLKKGVDKSNIAARIMRLRRRFPELKHF
jgi:hypothetical protein